MSTAGRAVGKPVAQFRISAAAEHDIETILEWTYGYFTTVWT